MYVKTEVYIITQKTKKIGKIRPNEVKWGKLAEADLKIGYSPLK